MTVENPGIDGAPGEATLQQPQAPHEDPQAPHEVPQAPHEDPEAPPEQPGEAPPQEPPATAAAAADRAAGVEVDVVREVDRILDWSLQHNSRIGYFAALYHHVAIGLSEALKKGEFHDAVAMERLNETFFSRYLDAVHHVLAGEPTTAAWQVAFDEARNRDLVVAQHLLLGANAHINFDLAIAVAETIPEADLAAFLPDFNLMNDVLGALIAGMAADISLAWPLLRLVSRYSAGADDAIVDFSLKAARADAWQTAVRLAGMDPEERKAAIDQRDAEVRDLARLVVNPGLVLRAVLLVVRAGERGGVRHIIHDLLH